MRPLSSRRSWTALPLIVAYVDAHKHEFGVEPICAALTAAGTKIAPSTYYAARSHPPSARAVRDTVVTEKIKEVHEKNYGVYGIREVCAELARQGGVGDRSVARCTVARLMKLLACKEFHD